MASVSLLEAEHRATLKAFKNFHIRDGDDATWWVSTTLQKTFSDEVVGQSELWRCQPKCHFFSVLANRLIRGFVNKPQETKPNFLHCQQRQRNAINAEEPDILLTIHETSPPLMTTLSCTQHSCKHSCPAEAFLFKSISLKSNGTFSKVLLTYGSCGYICNKMTAEVFSFG